MKRSVRKDVIPDFLIILFKLIGAPFKFLLERDILEPSKRILFDRSFVFLGLGWRHIDRGFFLNPFFKTLCSSLFFRMLNFFIGEFSMGRLIFGFKLLFGERFN